MSVEHVVENGEHLAAIVAQHGFSAFEMIWELPENESLRASRPNPHVLFRGDRVHLPDREARQERAHLEVQNRFRVTRSKLKLKLSIQDSSGAPLRESACVLDVDGQSQVLETDGSGILEMEIPATARSAQLELEARNLRLDLEIGGLDPVDEFSGLRQRLHNLGYDTGASDDIGSQDFLAALQEFQCDAGLNVSGELDAATIDQLLADHGC